MTTAVTDAASRTDGAATSVDDHGNFKPRDRASAVARHYSYYRPAILVLLLEHESHGYELLGRIAELGFEARDSASLYGVLRGMENESLVASSWDTSAQGGPPRRIYAITPSGRQHLSDFAPLLEKQNRAIELMLERYRAAVVTGE